MSKILSDERITEIRKEAEGHLDYTAPDPYGGETLDLARMVLELLADREETRRLLKETGSLIEEMSAECGKLCAEIAEAIALLEEAKEELKQGSPTS